MEWVYADVAAYVGERLVPGRTRAQEFSSGACGTAVSGCSANTLSYEYDPAGRLLRRRWTISTLLNVGPEVTGELQSVTFTAWDAFGRPTSGVWREAGLDVEVAIRYDQTGRETWSNGEERVRDPDGNLIRDVTVFRNGDQLIRRDYDFVIEAKQPLCLERQ